MNDTVGPTGMSQLPGRRVCVWGFVVTDILIFNGHCLQWSSSTVGAVQVLGLVEHITPPTFG